MYRVYRAFRSHHRTQQCWVSVQRGYEEVWFICWECGVEEKHGFLAA